MSTGLPDWFSRVQAEMLFLFLDLSDVPADYVGSALKGVRVNAAESGLEFASLAHTLASHTTKAHAELTDVAKDQHHSEDHYSRHEAGGADEISVQGLLGLLADDQHVLDAEVLEVAAPKGIVVGHSNTIEAATFNLTWTKICKKSITITKTSSVFVCMSMSAFYSSDGQNYRMGIFRDGAEKVHGPMAGMPHAWLNSACASSWVESGLVAGTYEFQLYAVNTSNNNDLIVGEVFISIMAVPE